MKLIIWLKLFFIFFIYITSVFGARPTKPSEYNVKAVQDCKAMKTGYVMDITSQVGVHVCGGTLITRLNVLTAAHCQISQSRLYAIDKDYRDYYYSRYKGAVTGAGHYLKEVRNTFLHPKYDAKTSENDIAVMTLMSEIRSEVTPVRLPTNHLSSSELPQFCPVATVMAWGKDQLVCGQVATITVQECEEDFYDLGRKVLCTKDNSYCYGDSGGPLLCCGDDLQYGIVSQKMECNDTGPTAYTRIDLFLDFIEEHKKMRSGQTHQTLPIQSVLLFGIVVIVLF